MPSRPRAAIPAISRSRLQKRSGSGSRAKRLSTKRLQRLTHRGGERGVVLRLQGLRVDDEHTLRGVALGKVDRRIAGLQASAQGDGIFYRQVELRHAAGLAGR